MQNPSENPFSISSRQSFLSFPYFFANQLLCPFLIKCGGSKTTSEKLLSGNGSAVKSTCKSGLIVSVRFPPELDLSLSSWLSRRLSQNIASWFWRLNQNIRLPQQISIIGFVLFMSHESIYWVPIPSFLSKSAVRSICKFWIHAISLNWVFCEQ